MSELDYKKALSQNIQNYLDANGKTRHDLAKGIGVSYSTLSNWMNALVYPRVSSIQKIADYFHVTKDALMSTEPKSDVEKSFVKEKREAAYGEVYRRALSVLLDLKNDEIREFIHIAQVLLAESEAAENQFRKEM